MLVDPSRGTYGCALCPYRTDRRNNLKRHTLTMHETPPTPLECCGARFPSKAEMRAHTLRFHRDGYVCPSCGRTFCRRALLKRHFAVHSGVKDFSCESCGYETSHKSNLERHRRVHRKEGLRTFELVDRTRISGAFEAGSTLPYLYPAPITLRPPYLCPGEDGVSSSERNRVHRHPFSVSALLDQDEEPRSRLSSRTSGILRPRPQSAPENFRQKSCCSNFSVARLLSKSPDSARLETVPLDFSVHNRLQEAATFVNHNLPLLEQVPQRPKLKETSDYLPKKLRMAKKFQRKENVSERES